jgi:hypothetical protein
MIIYGTRASHLRSVQLTHDTCEHCGTQGSITLSTFARYAHIFWIPLFSIGRTGASQCQHCKQVLELGKMSPVIRSRYQDLIKETKIPIWHFAGLAIIGVLVVFGIQSSAADAKNEEEYFKTPAIGDLYELKTDEGSFTSFKVTAVSNDSLWVRWNLYEVNKASGLYKLDKEENYSEEAMSIARIEVADLKKTSKIYNIKR